MINNVSVIEHDKLILYSLDDFAMDKDLQRCIWNAKVEAISLKNASCQVEKIGHGSANNTFVFCIPNPDISGEKLALKLVSYITTTYPPEQEADEAVRDLVNNTPKNNRVIDEIINSLKTKDCRNVIPLSGHDTIIWKCPKYNRIGIDYALKMPLAECINDTISKYVARHNNGTDALITEEKPETEKTILEIGLDLCIALQDLHAHGISHRDIKPGNIFLYKEHYCLGDFGIAVENPSSQDFRVGTQDYWAPEQAGDMFSDKYDHRMDIYSLGLVLYELADTMPVSMHYRDRMKGQSLPDLSSVSKGLNKILHKACQFDPDNRYQNAEAFWADLHLLQNKHDYIPVYQSPEESHEYATSKNKSAGTPSNTAYSSGQKRNPYGRKQARKKLEDFIISPETVWNAGKFWYDESCKRGNRFSGFDIDRRIMPLSVTSNHVIDFPVNVVTDQETVKNQKPLSEIISNIEKIHNMYLIGEGGIGKTTALYSVMKDAYREKLPSKSENEKQIIPLFIELSKAPAEYCSAYESSHSTFIRRYLFMLINSFHSQHLISESAVEMTRIMQMDMISSVQKIDALLRKSPNNVQYLLLLDGLNEVSRKQLSIPGNDYMGSPLEFIVGEIHELLKYSNVSVIITSRADESLGDSENIFDRLYLTGVSKRAIKKYLTQHEISYKRVKENKRLIETLRIPLFLKLYSQLYSTSEVFTPGEILYAFFSERSAKYTIRNRISEIKADHRMSGENPASNRIDEKLQWFILDFLLPELGWYMEKNDLYTVNLETIKQVVDSVLKGTSETDICGKYGKAMFCDYHNGKDGSVNTRTYADKLLHLNLSKQSYMQTIVDYCVYSFGILYVNNQNYGFIHQHIRDFFAALKTITNIKFAMAIYHTDKVSSLECVHELNNILLDESVSQFMSDLSRTLSRECGYDFYPTALEIYRNVYNDEAALGVKNIARIIYEVRGDLSNINFSELDLRNLHLYGINISNSKFTDVVLNRKNFFSKKGSTWRIRDAVFSPDHKHILALEGDIFRIYNAVSLYEEFVSSEYKSDTYSGEIVEYSPSGNLFFVLKTSDSDLLPYIVEIWDAKKHKMITRKLLFRLYHRDMDFTYRRFIKISPDDNYLIVAGNLGKFTLYPIFSKDKKRRIFTKKRTLLNSIARLFYGCSCIATDPCKKYIAFENPYFGARSSLNIFLYNAKTLEYETDIIVSTVEKQEFIYYLLFSPEGEYLVVFSSETIYIINSCDWKVHRTLSNKTKYGEIMEYKGGKFVYYNKELCLLLEIYMENAANKYILWCIETNNLIYKSFKNGEKIFDCLGTSMLFNINHNLKLQKNCSVTFNEYTVCKYHFISEDSTRISDAFYTLDRKYLIIYSNKYIQMLDSSTYNLLHELVFEEKIAEICCSDSNLYIAYSNGNIEVMEIETRRIRQRATAPFSKVAKILLSPQQKYIMIQHNIEDEAYTFTLYDAHSLNHIFTFYGNDFLFDDSDEKIMIGFDSKYGSKMMEQWNIKKSKDDEHYEIEKVNTATWEPLLKKIKKYDWTGIYDWISIPNTNKIALYIRKGDSCRLCIWNLDTGTCENIIKAMFPHNLFCKPDGFYILESGIDNATIKIRNFKTLKYTFKSRMDEPHYITTLAKAYEKEILNPRPADDAIEILNLETKEYKTIFFLPGIHVQNAKFTQFHPSSDIDTTFLKSLKMHGAIIEYTK